MSTTLTQAQEIAMLLAELECAKAEAEQEIPGWVLRRPHLSEIEERIAFVVARSKAQETAPFTIPDKRDACIFVTEGAVQVKGGPTICANSMEKLPAGETEHELISLVHPTTVVVMFFRLRVSDGPELDSR